MKKYWCRECTEDGFIEANDIQEARFILQCCECNNDAGEGDICYGPMDLDDYRSYCLPDKYVTDDGYAGSCN